MPAQIKMIDSINRLLSRNDTAVQLNPEGVCGGLVCLRIRYRLEGRELEFFDLCRRLANPPKDYTYGNGDQLDLFIRDVEIEFNRNKYTKAKSLQGDMEHSAFIQGKPIKKEFAIGLVDSKANWASLLEQLRHDGRSCYVASHNHAIEMTFENGRYEIYDPNYDEDNPNQPISTLNTKNVRTFSKATDVINELSRQFGYPDEQVGLCIHIYAHPNESRPAVYPDKSALIKGFTQSDFDRKIGIPNKKWVYNSFYFAAFVNDRETIQAYLDNNQVSPFQVASLMHKDQWNDELVKLYQKKDRHDQLHMLTYALWKGNISLFERLLKDCQAQHTSDDSKQNFKTYISQEFDFLVKAAECGNAACLKAAFKLYDEYSIDYFKIPHQILATILEKISAKGDIDSLKTLRAHLPHLSLDYLKEALRFATEYNRQPVVQFWLNEIEQLTRESQSEATKDRNLSLKSVQKLSLPIFKRLLALGFKVHSTLIPQLLKRKDLGFFDTWFQQNPESPYHHLLPGQNPDLSQGIDLTTFQILCRYGRNELIEKNWPEDANQFGEQALAFACETGNQSLVKFLTSKGFSLETASQIKTLKKALTRFEFDKVQAILTVPLNAQEFFTEANKPLIYKLISAQEIDFIFRAWKELSRAQKQDYMLHAIGTGNRQFCQKVATRYPLFASSFIEFLLDVYQSNHQFTQVLDAAIHLADSLKTNHFAECFHKLTDAFSQEIHSRAKTDNPSIEKEFLAKARQSISGLIALLMHAIEHHQFAFALKLMSFIHLNQEEQQLILVKAHTQKDTAILEFMLEHYRGFRTNPQHYFNLDAQKEYGLLAKLLEGEQILDDKVYMALLKSAVARSDERLISLLRRHINAAYRPQGSPIYHAIEQGNVAGILLLLRHGAKINQHPIPGALLTLALKQDSAQLLTALLREADFRHYFTEELGENLNQLFNYSTPAVILCAVDQVNLVEKYEEFLHHAMTHDDVPLLQRLKQAPQFKTVDLKKLFAVACEHQACAVVNELLASPLSFDDTKALHGQLDMLFGVADKQSNIDAQAIYNRVYPKALYRLYELAKAAHYRPFAALYSSIYTMIGDENLFKASQVQNKHRNGLLRSRLIRNALDKGDPTILDQLLVQIEKKPSVNSEIMTVFADNLQKPAIIRVLLEYFPLDEVIREAVAQRQVLVIVTLLADKPATALSSDTLKLLQEHSELLFSTLIDKSKRELAEDPRARLNALLIPDSPLALAQALNSKTLALKKAITDIQDLMIQGKHDLKMHFYDFQLEKKLVDGLVAIEAIEPLIEKWVGELQNYAQDAAKLLEQPEAEEGIRKIKAHLEKHDLTPHHFDETNQLFALLDALKSAEVAKRQESLRQDPKQPEVSQAKGAESPPPVRELSLPTFVGNVVEKPTLKQLQTLLETYKTERAGYGNTRHGITWFQYTKDDKLLAVDHLTKALASPTEGINLQDEGVLLDGSLSTRLDDFMAAHGTPLARELGCKTKIRSLTDLIDFLNTRDPVSSLISILEQYKTARDTQPERYHWSIFSQFTRTEKQTATTHLIALMKGEPTRLNDTDMTALSQGSLGEEIDDFIACYGTQLQQTLGHEILCLNDLITAYHQKPGNSLAS